MILLTSLIINSLFVNIIKQAVERPRPPIEFALIVENNFSFPSGHSIVAVSFFGLILYFLIKSIKRKSVQIILLFFGIVLITLIGFSRIYLGVHWTSDVIASYLLGLSWIAFLLIIMDHIDFIKRNFRNLISHL